MNRLQSNRSHRQVQTGSLLVALVLTSWIGTIQSVPPQNYAFSNPTATAVATSTAEVNSGSSVFRPADSILPTQAASGPETMGYIKARGYIGEQYTILSKDNKTPLNVYHVINPHADPKTLYRYPVLVHHGVGCDSSNMIAVSDFMEAKRPTPGEFIPDDKAQSLAFLLANNNWDIWLTDARGTSVNNHPVSVDLDPIESNKYYDFTCDQESLLDLPAVVDFVLSQTHSDKLHYVGFSESTFFMFSLLAAIPEYQDKLVSYVALAPVAYVSHISGSGLTFFRLLSLIPDDINLNFLPEFATDTAVVNIRRMCNIKVVSDVFCNLFTNSIVGAGNDVHSPDYYMTLFHGTSVKKLKHFYQLHNQDRFGMYDHGPERNLQYYGTSKPPNFDLSKIIKPPIVLFRGGADFLSSPLDQIRLINDLGTKPINDFYYPSFSHFDILMGETIAKDINIPAARIMFDLLKSTAAQTGASILRDPIQNTEAPVKPLLVVYPDGSREVKFKSNLLKNLANGVLQVAEAKLKPLGIQLPGVSAQAKAGIEGQLNALDNLDTQVQNIATLGLSTAGIKLPEVQEITKLFTGQATAEVLAPLKLLG